MTSRDPAGWVSWRLLALMQLREHPVRTAATTLAIALGVALGVAVYLINSAALGQFDQATRQVIGDADCIVRGPPAGFGEQLFVQIARDPEVAFASPVLDLQVTLPMPRVAQGQPLGGASLQILGIDPFRAASIEPALMGALGVDITRLFAPDAIVLSHTAAAQLHLQRGAWLPVVVGRQVQRLRIVDVLPTDAYAGALGLMDIASAQWLFGRLGQLNRIDVRVRANVDADAFRRRLAARLPAGVIAVSPRIEDDRASTATRAYRVNLNVLSLVALLTGAFLVFATQSLAALRRRVILGLLRALGVTRGQLQRALVGEGTLIGLAGGTLGLVLGALLATAVLAYLGADLGNRQLAATGSDFALHPWAMVGFLAIGVGAASLGAWWPAYEAARRAPAAALKAGDVEPVLERLPAALPGLILLTAGALLAWVPPIDGLPLPGYASVGALLLGAVLLVPELTHQAMKALPHSGAVVFDTSVAQLRGSAGSSNISVAAVVVSFSLMVAMAIMVHSFRQSFDLWLVKLLPADLQVRVSPDSQTAVLDAPAQQRIAQLPQIVRVQFAREQQLYLRADHPSITLIARAIARDRPGDALPLVDTEMRVLPPGARPAWISESLQDEYALHAGDWLVLPLLGQPQRFVIAGVWRDYVHAGGAVVIQRTDYISASGDRTATEASIWRRPGTDDVHLQAAIRALLGGAGIVQMISSTELRERSLQAFDRAFLITYALEAVAVAIGLAGVSVAASAHALARRGQFGMLRHIGMLRRQILGMLAVEGVLQSAFAVACGLLLGATLSLILIYVINRQSFHWSIDFSVPWGQLVALSAALVAAAALTAVWSGRAAMGQDVIRAVREDW